MHSALVTARKNLSRNNADEVRAPTSAALRETGWRGPKAVTSRIGQRKPQFFKGEI